MDSKKTISVLDDLIEVCRDGQNGLKEAANQVTAPDIKTFLNQAVTDRSQLVSELEAEVRKLGGNPSKTGSTANALHRAWLNIKGTLAGKTDPVVLRECERGEESTVAAYKNALKSENLPGNVLAIVERQYQVVQRVHDRLKQMREAKTASAR